MDALNNLQEQTLYEFTQLESLLAKFGVDLESTKPRMEAYNGKKQMEITIQHPANPGLEIGITIDDDEIIVFLGCFHWHFIEFVNGRRSQEKEIASAIVRIKELLTKRFIITQYFRRSALYKETFQFMDVVGKKNIPETNIYGCLTMLAFFIPYRTKAFEYSFCEKLL